MMKILLTTDWYKPVINGVVTSVVNLANGLEALGHEVRVLTLSPNRHSSCDGKVTYIGSMSADLIYPNARLRTAHAEAYLEALIEWQPDVVHSQCEFSTFIMAQRIAASCACPLIHTYHTVYEDYTHYFSPSERFGKALAAWFSRYSVNKTQAVIVPTEKVRDLLIRYDVNAPISVVPSGLDLRQYRAPLSGEARAKKRQALDFGPEDKVLIYLGRLSKEKNISEVLALFAKHEDAHLKLLLVGDGPYRPTLEEEVAQLNIANRVTFTGMVAPDEVATYYSLGDIFVSASQSETQGLTYIEAMAAGLPLLCHYDDCLMDVVNNGVTGYTYTTEEEFHHYLDLLLAQDTHKEMGQAAKDRAFCRYSSKTFAEHVQDVYKEQLICYHAGLLSPCPI